MIYGLSKPLDSGCVRSFVYIYFCKRVHVCMCSCICVCIHISVCMYVSVRVLCKCSCMYEFLCFSLYFLLLYLRFYVSFLCIAVCVCLSFHLPPSLSHFPSPSLSPSSLRPTIILLPACKRSFSFSLHSLYYLTPVPPFPQTEREREREGNRENERKTERKNSERR